MCYYLNIFCKFAKFLQKKRKLIKNNDEQQSLATRYSLLILYKKNETKN